MGHVEDEWWPTVFVDGVPVASGRPLRSLLVLVLLDADRTLTLPDLVASVERAGFTLAGRPAKTVSDALRWEVRRGRVVRAGRGRYRSGHVAKSSRHAMRRRVALLHQRARRPAA